MPTKSKVTTKNSPLLKSETILDLKTKYLNFIAPELKKELKLSNINEIPKITKVIVNIGMGKLLAGSKDYSFFTENLSRITGQKPVVALAKKSISNFKLREKMPIGLFVTLRGKKMYDFINKLVNITFPRIRDFRGISIKNFDGKGNYSIGIKEHIVFPEINAEDISKIHGLQITVVTTAKNDNQGYILLKHLGFPFQEKKSTKIN